MTDKYDELVDRLADTYTYPDLASLLKKSEAWVRQKVNQLGIEPGQDPNDKRIAVFSKEQVIDFLRRTRFPLL